MDKPTKPTNLMPRSFGGVKNNFSIDLQDNGFEDGVPTIYGGDNLNYQLDATGQELDYCEKIIDFINAMPIGKTITVDSNNKLVYVDKQELPSQTGNAGKYLTTDGTAPSWTDLTGANRDLSNLTSTGEARLHALKGYSDNGELLTDAEGLADVIKYAHSTFDLSKFTVTGSPIVTTDGIASGLSSTSYILGTTQSLTNYNDWEVLTPEYNVKANGQQDGIFQMYGTGNNGILTGITSGGKWIVIIQRGSSYIDIIRDATLDCIIGSKYQFRITHNASTYTYAVYYKKDGGSWTYLNSAINNQTDMATGTGVFIGKNATGCSLDLKQLSITVDGVPVFNGNKTGIDTIKADDYTIVGSPTISTDGIASGFSSSNYINCNNSVFNQPNNFITECKIRTGNTLEGAILNSPNNSWGLYFSNNVLWFRVNSDATGTAIFNTSTSISLSTNTDYFIKTMFDGSNYKVYYGTSKNDIVLGYTFNSSTKPYIGNISFGKTSTGSSSSSIDLNSFKIYVDGDLVYQPCLKIPYTESKTGSKVVNAVYRDRVNDMAEQFGYANYYTLDENVGNFTLPQVELYGLINKIKQETPYIVDSGVSGTEWYIIYSDNRCIVGGLCTTGQTVSFSQPLSKILNYSVGIYYNSNQYGYDTITSFTTSDNKYVGFTFFSTTSVGMERAWRVEGYI